MGSPGSLDDQGRLVQLSEVRRVVSLVPSLTEAVAATGNATAAATIATGGNGGGGGGGDGATASDLLVGATDWCTHPADLSVARIGGTKNPDIDAIVSLAPDLVLANEEENRLADLDALRAAGIAVWVTEIRTLDQAFRSLDRMLAVACGLPRPDWLDQAEAAWQRQNLPVRPMPLRAIVPIWRRPWMVLGRDTFAGDLLRRLGITQVFADHVDRYPAIALDQLQAVKPDLIVLPDEPYSFTSNDGPEAFPGVPAALVNGRYLTWYGPSLVSAATILAGQLDARMAV